MRCTLMHGKAMTIEPSSGLNPCLSGPAGERICSRWAGGSFCCREMGPWL